MSFAGPFNKKNTTVSSLRVITQYTTSIPEKPGLGECATPGVPGRRSDYKIFYTERSKPETTAYAWFESYSN